ncbi:MAG: glycosyltransferase [Oscillospiraceae bacterium]|nr:glycosyltransferase [Oscillospiraceae bacterium]
MKKKVRILEVNKAYYPHIGGIESLVMQYSETFSRNNKSDLRVLVCRDEKGRTKYENINDVKVIRCGSFGTYFSCPISFSFISKFRKLSKNADIIHINTPFPLADLALLLSGYKGKVVISWHSDVVKQKKLLFFYKPLMMKMLKRADLIVTATQGHINGSPYISKFSKKCRVIPYGLDIEKYLSIKKRPILTEKLNNKSSLKVFFTGRLVYYKGVNVLINAFKKVRNCELFIAGTGTLENELKEYAEKNNMDSIHFLGFLEDNDLKCAFADCDIFVLPSVANSEAFGIVQLEAMVYSKPVINTSLPTGVPYVSVDGISGITVEPSNPEKLADAINMLAGDENLRHAYGANAFKRVRDLFNAENVLEELFDAITENR